VRVDTFAHAECTIPPYYDSLIAKIIVHGRDRQEAIARMRRTLEMTVIDGIKTSIPLQLKILAEPDFVAGRLGTAFMERFLWRRRAARTDSPRQVSVKSNRRRENGDAHLRGDVRPVEPRESAVRPDEVGARKQRVVLRCLRPPTSHGLRRRPLRPALDRPDSRQTPSVSSRSLLPFLCEVSS